MNNCQKIKMMDCETLATFLVDKFVGDCDICPAWKKECWETDTFQSPSYCRENMIEWLQSEVSE